jgi:hypothetical protein
MSSESSMVSFGFISHQPAVLLSQNKPASGTFISKQTSQRYFYLKTNQPPTISSTFINTNHQPNEHCRDH